MRFSLNIRWSRGLSAPFLRGRALGTTCKVNLSSYSTKTLSMDSLRVIMQYYYFLRFKGHDISIMRIGCFRSHIHSIRLSSLRNLFSGFIEAEFDLWCWQLGCFWRLYRKPQTCYHSHTLASFLGWGIRATLGTIWWSYPCWNCQPQVKL